MVQADDEVIAGARGGDVHHAHALLFVAFLVGREQLFIACRLQLHCLRACFHLDLPVQAVKQHGVSLVVCARAEPGQDQDREFETLGGVNGHHAYRALVGLLDGGLQRSCLLLALAGCPRDVGAQRCLTGRGEGAGAVDKEVVALPAAAPLPFVEGQLPQLTCAHEALDQSGRGGPSALFVERFQRGQGCGDAPGRRLAFGKVVELSAIFDEF